MNYIIFFPDELRAETLSIYGNDFIKTPNYDRLASQGVVFNQCHVQNPVCSPSRCSLVSGQYVHSAGHRNLWNLIKPYEHNLFRYMKEAGYEVRSYGKNDLFSKDAASLSADVFDTEGYGFSGKSQHAPVKAFGEKGYYDFLCQPLPGSYTEHVDYHAVRKGIDFIKGRKQGDKPFVLFLPLVFPHCPYTAHEPYYSMYDRHNIPPLKPSGENKARFQALARQYRNIEGYDLSKVQAVYMGMTSFIDTLLGELMDAVEDGNIKNETMLIASSDHGDYAGDYGLVEKWPAGFDDVLTRVPLVISSPLCKAGRRINAQVELFDIMATIIEDAGIKTRHTHYARSLLPQLGGEEGDMGRAVFCEGGYNRNEAHCNPGTSANTQGLRHPEAPYYPKMMQQREEPETVGRGTMIRTLTHKLVLRSYGDHELYDLKKDPWELCNVYGRNEYAGVQAELERRMLDWYIATSDSVPTEEDTRW
jgi:choline-sulfatase